MPPGIISLTGGGGKSTLMYTLGKALADKGNNGQGARVLLTTTTRILRPSPEESEHKIECESPEDISLPEEPSVVTAARPAGAGQKEQYLRGFSPEEIDKLWEKGIADWIIVEADGSSCRPLKAPVAKEPVIPRLTAATIAVAGLSAIYKPYADTWVFRPEAFSSLTGLNPGDMLIPEAVAAIFCNPAGLFKGTPQHARRMVFLNQADAPQGLKAAVELSGAILRQMGTPFYGVYAGSAAQQGAPCLRFSMPLQCYQFFEDRIRPHLKEYALSERFFPEGIVAGFGDLTRIELSGRHLYACIDFHRKGVLDINVMDKLGQGPLLNILLTEEQRDRQEAALYQLRDLLLQCGNPA